MHVVAGGIKLNSGEGEEQKVDIQQIIGKYIYCLIWTICIFSVISILLTSHLGHPDYSSNDLTNDICLLKVNIQTSLQRFISF